MLLGPVALWGFKSFKSFCLPFGSTLMSVALWVLLGPRSDKFDVSSLVKTELIWFLMMFAWFCQSQKVNPSFLMVPFRCCPFSLI